MLSSSPKKSRRLIGSSLSAVGAAAGIAIPIIFTVLVAAASLLRPGYSQIADIISLLGVGPNALIQNVNFVIIGILSIPFGLALGDALNDLTGRRTRTLKVVLVVFGVAIILAGNFSRTCWSFAFE